MTNPRTRGAFLLSNTKKAHKKKPLSLLTLAGMQRFRHGLYRQNLQVLYIHIITKRAPGITQGHETGLTHFRQVHDTPSQGLGILRRLSQKTVIFNNVVFQGVKKQHFLTPSSFNKHKSLPRHTGRGGFCTYRLRGVPVALMYEL